MKARENPLIDPDEYVFNFGKYKGWFYGDVRDQVPQYIQWCDDNLNWFNLTDEEREYIDELVYDEQDLMGYGPDDIY